MRIVITGAGFTGVQLAQLLVNEKHNVVLIENDEEIARHAADRLDCTVITADGNNLETLEKAGIAKAEIRRRRGKRTQILLPESTVRFTASIL